MEVNVRRPPRLVFPIPLSGVKGIEKPAKVIDRLKKPWQGASKR